MVIPLLWLEDLIQLGDQHFLKHDYRKNLQIKTKGVKRQILFICWMISSKARKKILIPKKRHSPESSRAKSFMILKSNSLTKFLGKNNILKLKKYTKRGWLSILTLPSKTQTYFFTFSRLRQSYKVKMLRLQNFRFQSNTPY